MADFPYHVVGMDVNAAQHTIYYQAASIGQEYKVQVLDMGQLVTADFDPDRIRLWVKDGIVKEVTTG